MRRACVPRTSSWTCGSTLRPGMNRVTVTRFIPGRSVEPQVHELVRGTQALLIDQEPHHLLARAALQAEQLRRPAAVLLLGDVQRLARAPARVGGKDALARLGGLDQRREGRWIGGVVEADERFADREGLDDGGGIGLHDDLLEGADDFFFSLCGANLLRTSTLGSRAQGGDHIGRPDAGTGDDALYHRRIVSVCPD